MAVSDCQWQSMTIRSGAATAVRTIRDGVTPRERGGIPVETAGVRKACGSGGAPRWRTKAVRPGTRRRQNPANGQAGAERERDANLPAQAERPGAERSGMVLPCLPIAGAALVRRKAGREEMAITPRVGKVREEAYARGLSLMPRARREVCTLPFYPEGAEEAPPRA